MLSLLKHELWSRRNAVVGWGIGLSIFAAVYLGIYPEMAEEIQMMDLSDISFYQAMGVEMGSFEGFLSSTVMQFMTLILGIYAILGGAGALAGEEDSGTLELLVSAPIPRWQIVVAKALALGVIILLIQIIAASTSVALFNSIAVETDVTLAQLFLAILSGWPILFAFAMISLFLGAYLPTRRVAAMVATALYIASYFGEGVLGMTSTLQDFKPLALFYYYDASPTVFEEGYNVAHVALLLGIAAVALALALLSFQRRNITVGAWPWQRAAAP